MAHYFLTGQVQSEAFVYVKSCSKIATDIGELARTRKQDAMEMVLPKRGPFVAISACEKKKCTPIHKRPSSSRVGSVASKLQARSCEGLLGCERVSTVLGPLLLQHLAGGESCHATNARV